MFGACNTTCGDGWMNRTRICSGGTCGNCNNETDIDFLNCTVGRHCDCNRLFSCFSFFTQESQCSILSGVHGALVLHAALMAIKRGFALALGTVGRHATLPYSWDNNYAVEVSSRDFSYVFNMLSFSFSLLGRLVGVVRLFDILRYWSEESITRCHQIKLLS